MLPRLENLLPLNESFILPLPPPFPPPPALPFTPKATWTTPLPRPTPRVKMLRPTAQPMRVGLEARRGPATAAAASRWGSWTSGRERAAEAPSSEAGRSDPAPGLWPRPGVGRLPALGPSPRSFSASGLREPLPFHLPLPSLPHSAFPLRSQPRGNSHRPQGLRIRRGVVSLAVACVLTRSPLSLGQPLSGGTPDRPR